MRSAEVQRGGTIYSCVGLEIAHVIEVEALAEEVFGKGLRRIDLAVYFFLIIASDIEAGFRIQTAKIGLSADVVPMRVGNQDGGQLRQIRSVGAERFVSGLCGVGAGSRVDPDQLLPIVRDDEIIFREFKTRQSINSAWNNFCNATRRKSVARQCVF